MKNKYDDMIHLPHHVSPSRPRMAMGDRAAQFSPFAALTGHSDAVKETVRAVETRAELDESAKAVLDGKLQTLSERACEHLEVMITFFQPDNKKAGGTYVTTSGVFKKINEYDRTVMLADHTKIPIEDIFEVECELFENID